MTDELPAKRKPRTPAEHLVALRAKHKLTQLQVAQHVGVAKNTVWKWEAGQEPARKHRIALAQLFDVNPKIFASA